MGNYVISLNPLTSKIKLIIIYACKFKSFCETMFALSGIWSPKWHLNKGFWLERSGNYDKKNFYHQDIQQSHFFISFIVITNLDNKNGHSFYT